MKVTEKNVSACPGVEAFVLLAKSAHGAAAVELIKQALEAPGVYVFAELLDMPNIKELQNGECASHFRLLHLFAYGTYKDYRETQDSLPPLTSLQLHKLRHLTIVSLANKNKCIPYSVLLQELALDNLRELEDLIIEAIYSDIIRGKLDQQNAELEVDYAIGRDIKSEDVAKVISTLSDWCASCNNVLSVIEQEVQTANQSKEKRTKHKETIEQEVVNIRKSLKAQETDDAMPGADVQIIEKGKGKGPGRAKGIVRSAGKLWSGGQLKQS